MKPSTNTVTRIMPLIYDMQYLNACIYAGIDTLKRTRVAERQATYQRILDGNSYRQGESIVHRAALIAGCIAALTLTTDPDAAPSKRFPIKNERTLDEIALNTLSDIDGIDFHGARALHWQISTDEILRTLNREYHIQPTSPLTAINLAQRCEYRYGSGIPDMREVEQSQAQREHEELRETLAKAAR